MIHGKHTHARPGALRALAVVAMICSAASLAACGGSGGGTSVPTVAPAATYGLERFQPAASVVAGRPTRISFSIRQPSGSTLTAYRKCCDPHAGVDLIIVRSDDSNVQYDDSAISPSGEVSQPVVFPTPGRYRIIIDAYPAHHAADAPVNFQLFHWVDVRGSYHPQTVPPYHAIQEVGGYRFQVRPHAPLKAIQATFLNIKVTDPHGHPAAFSAWHGALAHAIFIRRGSLDYFHTHVCSPGAMYCTSVLGAARVTGSSSVPGVLRVGVLLPAPGTWRMFLLTYIHGRHLVTPITLNAGS